MVSHESSFFDISKLVDYLNPDRDDFSTIITEFKPLPAGKNVFSWEFFRKKRPSVRGIYSLIQEEEDAPLVPLFARDSKVATIYFEKGLTCLNQSSPDAYEILRLRMPYGFELPERGITVPPAQIQLMARSEEWNAPKLERVDYELHTLGFSERTCLTRLIPTPWFLKEKVLFS